MRRVFAAIGLLLAAVLTTAILIGSWHGGEHANFWATAIPGTLTGIGTLALAAATYAVLRGDQQDRREREEREQRDQASRVHPGVPKVESFTHNTGSGSAAYILALDIANNSQYPVRNVHVWLLTQVDSNGQIRAIPLFLHEYVEQIDATKSVCVPFTQQRWALRPDTLTTLQASKPAVAIAFTDTNGLRWLRNPDWALDKVDANALITPDSYKPYNAIPSSFFLNQPSGVVSTDTFETRPSEDNDRT